MVGNFVCDIGVCDGRDDLHGTFTIVADKNVHREHTLEELGPGESPSGSDRFLCCEQRRLGDGRKRMAFDNRGPQGVTWSKETVVTG